MGKIAKIEPTKVEVVEKKEKVTGAFPATKPVIYSDLIDVQVDVDMEDEITKRTCPECSGTGTHERREETATSYSVSSSKCWLCKGNCVVGPEELGVYAKIRERFGT